MSGWKETPTTARALAGFQGRICSENGYLEAEEQEAERTGGFGKECVDPCMFCGKQRGVVGGMLGGV